MEEWGRWPSRSWTDVTIRFPRRSWIGRRGCFWGWDCVGSVVCVVLGSLCSRGRGVKVSSLRSTFFSTWSVRESGKCLNASAFASDTAFKSSFEGLSTGCLVFCGEIFTTAEASFGGSFDFIIDSIFFFTTTEERRRGGRGGGEFDRDLRDEW